MLGKMIRSLDQIRLWTSTANRQWSWWCWCRLFRQLGRPCSNCDC